MIIIKRFMWSLPKINFKIKYGRIFIRPCFHMKDVSVSRGELPLRHIAKHHKDCKIYIRDIICLILILLLLCQVYRLNTQGQFSNLPPVPMLSSAFQAVNLSPAYLSCTFRTTMQDCNHQGYPGNHTRHGARKHILHRFFFLSA